jgi:hypothetical protein
MQKASLLRQYFNTVYRVIDERACVENTSTTAYNSFYSNESRLEDEQRSRVAVHR